LLFLASTRVIYEPDEDTPPHCCGGQESGRGKGDSKGRRDGQVPFKKVRHEVRSVYRPCVGKEGVTHRTVRRTIGQKRDKAINRRADGGGINRR
jgi:hypothetical protein